MKDVKKFSRWDAIKLFEHPARRVIVDLCHVAPRSIQDLATETELNPGSVHNHVHKLRAAGFLEVVATRVVNGIVERKYACTARHFDFSEVDARDRPKRNKYIARYVEREVTELLAADEGATVLRFAADLSPTHRARARALIDELRRVMTEQNGSGDVPCTLVVAFGRRTQDDDT
jgi:predicted ArsR family transcriptional regulator